MMRNLSNALACCGDWLPADSFTVALAKLLHAGKIDAPHRRNGALFQVSATMDIHVLAALIGPDKSNVV